MRHLISWQRVVGWARKVSRFSFSFQLSMGGGRWGGGDAPGQLPLLASSTMCYINFAVSSPSSLRPPQCLKVLVLVSARSRGPTLPSRDIKHRCPCRLHVTVPTQKLLKMRHPTPTAPEFSHTLRSSIGSNQTHRATTVACQPAQTLRSPSTRPAVPTRVRALETRHAPRPPLLGDMSVRRSLHTPSSC